MPPIITMCTVRAARLADTWLPPSGYSTYPLVANIRSLNSAWGPHRLR